MYGRFRSLLGSLSLMGLSLTGLSLVCLSTLGLLSTGCAGSTEELCQSEADCAPGEACTAAGDCELRDSDAGAQPDSDGVGEVDRVEISPAQAEVGLGLTMSLEATAFDAQGEEVRAMLFEWESSNPETVSVDDRGVVNAESLGAAEITAQPITGSQVQGRSQISVIEGDIASVVISPDPFEVLPGRTGSAIATAYNEAVEPIEASQPVWRVEDEAIATVGADGVVEGVVAGQTRLIANIEGVEGSVALEVLPMPVDRVEISPAEPATAVGENVQLEATGYDATDAEISGQEAEWTSDNEAVATVDAGGLVRGVAVGSAQISVEMGVVSSQVTVTIVEANHPPVARDHTVSTQEDSAVDLTLGASDEDGDALTFAIASEPTQGALSALDAASGSLTYTPGADYAGADSFAFSVTDGEYTATATVSIQVTAVNDAPVAQDDTASAAVDATVTIDVLSNDSDVDSGDTLTVSATDTSSTTGSVTLKADGTVDYTAGSSAGTDTFGYTVSDGNGGTDSATVTITVQ
jgi:hypothetical protein